MIQESRLIWHETKPRFEDVEGKLVVIKNKDKSTDDKFLYPSYQIRSRGTYSRAFDDDCIAFAILSDESECCEWEKITEGEHKNYFKSECTKDYKGHKGAFRVWAPVLSSDNFCHHCGLPIKIITEPEAIEVLGMKPKKYMDISTGTSKHYYAIITEDMYISGANLEDKCAALESWNKLATKMKGG